MQILGYKDTRHALKRHVDNEDKILHLMRPQCWNLETGYQQNASNVRSLNKMTPEGNGGRLLTSLAFISLYYPRN